ncbi:MAG: AAA family ATPase [Candidatus Merdivicinus sp.]
MNAQKLSENDPKNQVIALTSGKGGVGKSTLCVGLGLGDAMRGKRVLLIEFDAGLRGLDLMLGISDQVVYDLGDLLEGRCTISKAIAESPLNENLNAIVAPVNMETAMNLDDIKLLVEGLRPHFDRLILDMPAGLGFSVKATAATADLALIIATPDRICVRDGSQMTQALQKIGFFSHRLIINRVNEKLIRKDTVTDLDAVIDGVGSQLIGVMPDDPDIQLKLTRGVALRENHRVTRICRAISRRIDGEYLPLIFS